MQEDWTKVDFRNPAVEQQESGLLRPAQEALAKDLTLGLSAFLRSSVIVTAQSCGEMLFSHFLNGQEPSCFGMALTRPLQSRLLLQLEYGVLFPMLGIALGAKPGQFTSPKRKPTEIELQVVNLIFRMVLTEAYRAWATPLKKQLETVSLDIDQKPGRSFSATETVLATRFLIKMGEHSGQLSILAPAALFSEANPESAAIETTPGSDVDAESTMELLLPATVAVSLWLDGSEMKLGDLLQLNEGQIVKLNHPVERRAVVTLNGTPSFVGQVVSTGTRRAFMLEGPAD